MSDSLRARIDQVKLHRERMQQAAKQLDVHATDLLNALVDLESELDCSERGCGEKHSKGGEPSGRCFS